MEIVILRHGKPTIETKRLITASDFGLWVDAYNRAGIDIVHTPSSAVIEKSRHCSAVLCSDLPRSIESAKILGVNNNVAHDSLFRECEMPYANWSFPKLSVPWWSVIFRSLQEVGYTSNAESFKEARERAILCAKRLIKLAEEHESVLFVGHGALNWLILKNLLRMGWEGPKNPGHGYWDYGVYHYKVT